MAKIVVIGAGYVGLTSAACFAHLGHHVLCIDVDSARIDAINQGNLPIIEEGLTDLVATGRVNGNLSFTTEVGEINDSAEILFLCVPTPQSADGSADLSFVQMAASQLSSILPKGSIVVNKSTVPVGSTKIVEEKLQRPDVAVVSNPEFLREGTAVYDFLHPDRIVVGADDLVAAQKVASLYESLGAPILVTDPASAETIKYAANAFLATKISFINAVAAICEGVGADVNDVVAGLGFDKRIGNASLKPGPGWGGSCLPKDTKALVKIGEQIGYDFNLLRGVIAVNEQQLERVIEKTRKAVGGNLKEKVVAVWGLTFKAKTGDLRDSPALKIIDRLTQQGAIVQAHDPSVMSSIDVESKFLVFDSALDALSQADVLLVLTEWEVFRSILPRQGVEKMKALNVVDARNLLDKELWAEAGFAYQGIGR
jgi:UDPglucose 6-dehydrogenase